MIPLYEEEGGLYLKLFSIISFLFIANILVFAMMILSGDPRNFFLTFGITPERILGGKDFWTLFTAMFIHVGFSHLIGNMWVLWIFGNSVEKNLGAIRFLILYLGAGLIASVVHLFTVPIELAHIPAGGASGAISGVLGAYIVLFPHNHIRTLTFLVWRPFLFSLPAFFFIGVWFLYQLLYLGVPNVVTYMANIGGFVSGIILTFLLRRPITS